MRRSKLRDRSGAADLAGENIPTKSYNNVAEKYKNERNAKEHQKNTPGTPKERVQNTGLSE